MDDIIKKIENKIIERFKPKKIQLIDKTYLHTKHKFFDKQKVHLKLIIDCPELKQLNVIQANRLIFDELREEIKNKVHALQIEIK